jgi:hypothetical protein
LTGLEFGRMSKERMDDRSEAIRKPFPGPVGFSRLLILRAETGPSLALTMVVVLVLAMLVFALRTVLSSEDMQNPTVTVTEVVLSEGDRETLELIESEEPVGQVQVAEVDSPSETGPPNTDVVPLEVDRPPDLPDSEFLPEEDGDGVEDAQGRLDDLLKTLERLKKKKATSRPSSGTPRGKAQAGVPSGKELSKRLKANGAGSGDIQVSLAWNNGNDLDLIMVCPSGEVIFFGRRRSACGGRLDIDRNAAGPFDFAPVENIFWPTGTAPSGRFTVLVKHYRNHGSPDPTGYVVRVTGDGKSREFRGTVRAFQPPVRVHQFTRP